MNEMQLKSKPVARMKDKLAAWLSILLDSSVLAVPIFIGAAWSEVGAFLPALGWAALTLLFADGVPLTYIALGRRFGWVSGFDLPRREERAPFIAVNLVGNALGYFLLRALNAPDSLSALLLGGGAGFAAFLTWVFGPVWALTFLAIPLVGWARVYRKRHNWAQVAAGGIVGTSVTLIVLAIALGNG